MIKHNLKAEIKSHKITEMRSRSDKLIYISSQNDPRISGKFICENNVPSSTPLIGLESFVDVIQIRHYCFDHSLTLSVKTKIISFGTVFKQLGDGGIYK